MIEIETSFSDDAERPTKDAEENDEDDNPPLVSNGPPALSSARVESSRQRAASPHVATLSARAKSFARHRSAAAPAMRDERAAVASSIVPDDEPEPSGRRAKSLMPQADTLLRRKRISGLSIISEDATTTGVVARRDGGAAIRSDPSGGTNDDGRDDISLCWDEGGETH